MSSGLWYNTYIKVLKSSGLWFIHLHHGSQVIWTMIYTPASWSPCHLDYDSYTFIMVPMSSGLWFIYLHHGPHVIWTMILLLHNGPHVIKSCLLCIQFISLINKLINFFKIISKLNFSMLCTSLRDCLSVTVIEGLKNPQKFMRIRSYFLNNLNKNYCKKYFFLTTVLSTISTFIIFFSCIFFAKFLWN